MFNLIQGSGKSAQKKSAETTLVDAREILEPLRDLNRSIFASFENDRNFYSCNISAFNIKHGAVAISNIYPAIPLALLRKGNSVKLVSIEHGRTITLDCKYVEPLIPNEFALLQLKLPKQVEIISSRTHMNFLVQGKRTQNQVAQNDELDQTAVATVARFRQR